MDEENLNLPPKRTDELVKKDEILPTTSDIGDKSKEVDNKPEYRDSYMDRFMEKKGFKLDEATDFYKKRKSSKN